MAARSCYSNLRVYNFYVNLRRWTHLPGREIHQLEARGHLRINSALGLVALKWVCDWLR